MRRWLCVTAIFAKAPDDWSAIHEVFERNGCGGTVESDFPPAMCAYLFEDERSEAVVTQLSAELRESGAIDVTVKPVPEENWAENWKQYFKPRRIGEKFLITPTWETEAVANDDDRYLILLDPGQAFGTGDHPTTRLALAAIEQHVKPGMSVADLGAGSGILSIGAIKLGASVFATEQDETSAGVANENFERNSCNVNLCVSDTVPDQVKDFDVVVSNIFTAVLIRLAPQIHESLKQNGTWIATGVIPQNFDDLNARATELGFTLQDKQEEEGWVLAVFRKK
ncbi:MAG: 50S ribosomal protein L11 methyltransferase [Fimbriimonadales bacterium]